MKDWPNFCSFVFSIFKWNRSLKKYINYIKMIFLLNSKEIIYDRASYRLINVDGLNVVELDKHAVHQTSSKLCKLLLFSINSELNWKMKSRNGLLLLLLKIKPLFMVIVDYGSTGFSFSYAIQKLVTITKVGHSHKLQPNRMKSIWVRCRWSFNS